jgi:hypothetical protein
MSLFGTIIKGAFGGFASGGVSGAITGALGGALGDDTNIARSLSGQVGCTITQANANQARALIARGIDPCTGQQKTVSQTAFDTGVPDRSVLFPTIVPGSSPIPVFETGPGGTPVPVNGQSSGALEFTRTGLIRNVIVNGRRVSRKNAAALIRKQGIEIGARALGLSLTQAAQVVLQQSSRPRRRRGITGRQITEARRVMNTINTFGKALGCTTRRAPARRKAACRS